MNARILTLALGCGAMLLIAQAVHAQSSQSCGEHAAVVAALAERYGETRQSIGLAANNQVVEVFASDETGTWTITVTTTSGVTCLVAAGQAFERTENEVTPAMLGDPV